MQCCAPYHKLGGAEDMPRKERRTVGVGAGSSTTGCSVAAPFSACVWFTRNRGAWQAEGTGQVWEGGRRAASEQTSRAQNNVINPNMDCCCTAAVPVCGRTTQKMSKGLLLPFVSQCSNRDLELYTDGIQQKGRKNAPRGGCAEKGYGGFNLKVRIDIV